MIIKTFHNLRPQTPFILGFLFILSRLPYLVYPIEPDSQANSLLGQSISQFLIQRQFPPIIWQLLDTILLFAQAMILNRYLIKYQIVPRQSFLVAFIFLLVSSVYPAWTKPDFQVIGQFFVLLSLINIFDLSAATQIHKPNIFYTALFLSLGSLFYFPVAYFSIFTVLSLILYTFAFADVLLLIIGLLFPYIMAGVFYTFSGDLPLFLQSFKAIFIYRDITNLDLTLLQYIGLLYLLLLSVLGFFFLRADRSFKVVQQRQAAFLIFFFVLVLIIIAPFAPGSSLNYAQMLSIPLSVFIARFFISPIRYFIRESLLWALVLFALFNHLYHLHVV